MDFHASQKIRFDELLLLKINDTFWKEIKEDPKKGIYLYMWVQPVLVLLINLIHTLDEILVYLEES